MNRSLFAVPLALSLALGSLAFSPAVGSADVITQVSAVDTLTSLTVNYSWDFGTPPPANDPITVNYGNLTTNWAFTLDSQDFLYPGTSVPLFKILAMTNGIHQTSPHGEPAPSSPSSNGGIILSPIAGNNGTSFGTILHDSNNSGHKDVWNLSGVVWGNGQGADVAVSAVHVPEPSSLALLGVGSLIGLGVYTRRRRQNA
ncbi:MAG: PEP-CTERM sorting domain-containing protein [Pirellulaceae bacterium]